MATHSTALAWRTAGTGSLVGCRLWGRTESDTTEATQQQQQQQQHSPLWASQVAQWVKNPPAMQEMHEFDPWVGKIPGRREWQPTPVFLPGESHGQKSLVGYSP